MEINLDLFKPLSELFLVFISISRLSMCGYVFLWVWIVDYRVNYCSKVNWVFRNKEQNIKI